MAKFLYANGCSWSFGNGIERDPNFISTGNMSKDLAIAHDCYSWPAVLSKKLSYEFINDALGAGSNKRMVRTTCDFLMNYPKEDYKELIVVLGWTTVERNEIHNYDLNQWLFFNARQIFSSNYPTTKFKSDYKSMVDEYQKLYVTYVYSEIENLTNYVHQRYMLSNMLENLGVKYIFFNSLPAVFDLEHKYDYRADLEKIKTKNVIADMTFDEFCRLNNFRFSPCKHPMIKAHQKWSDKLYDKLLSLYGDQL